MRQSWPFWLTTAALGTTFAVASVVTADAQATKQEAVNDSPGSKYLTPTLISSHLAVKPGEAFTLGLRLKISPGWHTYWLGDNDTGFAPKIDSQKLTGITLSEIQWPVPTRHVAPGDILDNIYEREVILPIAAKASATAKPGETLAAEIDLSFLVCDDTCLPGQAKLKITIPVKDASEPSRDAEDLKKALARVPVPLPAQSASSATLAWNDDVLTIHAPGAKWMAFYSAEDATRPINLLTEGEVQGETLKLKFERKAGKPPVARGVVEIRSASGTGPATGASPAAAGKPGEQPASTPATAPPAPSAWRAYLIESSPTKK